MHRLNPPHLDRSRQLRTEPTTAESALWQRLRGRQLQGAKFRRQHPLGTYVTDFACVERRLVIEVDGGQHAESERDAARDGWMRAQGWNVLRFWNNDVLENPEGVLEVITAQLRGTSPPPRPSPWKGEGGRR